MKCETENKTISIKSRSGFESYNIKVNHLKNSVSNNFILCFHDIGGSLQDFNFLEDSMKEWDFNLVRIDFKGHGLSSGFRGKIGSLNDFYVDIDHIVNSVMNEYFSECNKPKFHFVGIGGGGFLSLYCYLKCDWGRKVASAICQDFSLPQESSRVRRMLNFKSSKFKEILGKFEWRSQFNGSHFSLFKAIEISEVFRIVKDRIYEINIPILFNMSSDLAEDDLAYLFASSLQKKCRTIRNTERSNFQSEELMTWVKNYF